MLDMSWLFPSVVATFTGSITLSLVFFFLFNHYKDEFLFYIGLSWVIYSIRFFVMLIIVQYGANVYLIIANQFCTLFSGILLIYGIYIFTNAKFKKYWYIIFLLTALWIVVSNFFAFDFLNGVFFTTTFPLFTIIAFIYIYGGIKFIQLDLIKDKRTSKALGIIFIIWGLHKADYPFLRPVEWFAPIGYYFGALLEIMVAIGIILVFFQLNKELLVSSMLQVKDNINQIALLADNIRNPLMVLQGLSDLSPDSTTNDTLMLQIKEIEKIIEALDKNWENSAEIIEFMNKYGYN